MESRRVAALAGIVSVLGVVVQSTPSVLLERLVEGGLAGVIPTVGTTGQTVTLYSLLLETVDPGVTLALSVWLGYDASQRFDVAREHRRFGGAVAGGSLTGVAVVWIVLLATTVSGPPTASSILLQLVMLASLALRISLVVTVGAFAGAALSSFRTAAEPPTGTADANRSPSTEEESASEGSSATSTAA